ncbi:hypothetical protein PIROE2DRAFT_17599 [Piromyces sp. E2]|nr:hypothetical protein PIROE2DRAFT_17599 [Piromyces sp. E2]|eukprot:OUM57430.1 hypothetical protein PIROE2DRAFT_17599 [Piromyces sp. E2]
MLINPNELYDNLYDNLYDGFEKSMPIPLVACSNYAKKSLRIYCESVVDNYNRSEQYNRAYPIKDFIWHSLCGRLYFSYEAFIQRSRS